jgi:hypothetical protein
VLLEPLLSVLGKPLERLGDLAAGDGANDGGWCPSARVNVGEVPAKRASDVKSMTLLQDVDCLTKNCLIVTIHKTL